MSDITRRSVLGSMAVLGASPLLAQSAAVARPTYAGPNVVIVRFGGGVRRRETIDSSHTYAPYFAKKLVPEGMLWTDMLLGESLGASSDEVQTSHAQGTLYLLTGRYARYQDIERRAFAERFEPAHPTFPEYMRKQFDIPDHQCLIVNGEDRKNEEYLTFSNHERFGINYRSNTLSLTRYKRYLIERQIDEGVWKGNELQQKQKELGVLQSLDYRDAEPGGQGSVLEGFWHAWRTHYGDSGLVNPRGDRLLTELALWALERLKPRFMMVNFQDPDYVHWGNPSHYTRAIAIIDQGIRRIVEALDSLPEYRANTILAVVPDCGRDDNRYQRVPFQHHFNSRSAHEIFAYLRGPRVPRGTVVSGTADQIDVTSTLGALAGIDIDAAEGRVLV